MYNTRITLKNKKLHNFANIKSSNIKLFSKMNVKQFQYKLYFLEKKLFAFQNRCENTSFLGIMKYFSENQL